MRFAFVVGLLLVLVAPTWAQQVSRDPVLEKRFRDEVAAISAEAAVAFEQGNAARDAQRGDDAITAYRRALELAPNSNHVHRRLCGVLAAVQRFDEAVAECETALSLAPSSAFDQSALAAVLGARGRPDERQRAYDLARKAATTTPGDKDVQMVWCGAALARGDGFSFSTCSERLIELDPDGMQSNLYAALVAGAARDFDEAHRRLAKAKAAGLDPALFESLSNKLDDDEKQNEGMTLDAGVVVERSVLGFGSWALVLLVLFVVGVHLSDATLRTAQQTNTLDAAGTPGERRLRRIYKAVLLVAGLYFYLSIPLMLVAVLVAAGMTIYVLEEMGGVPIIVLWLLGVMIFATVAAVLRSLFVRAEPKPDGKRIDLAASPQLRALLHEVAAEVGTRPVDVVYLLPGTEIAVTEHTGLLRTLARRPSERRLLLGIAQFDGMTQLQLRSILAHEYGHFRNHDTAGGGFALAVRRSLVNLGARLAESGGAHWFNPVWWFVRAFWRMYFGISHGASRLQEVLADRWAVRAYGSAAFVSGYRHVVSRTVEFEHDLDEKIKEVLEHNWSLPNLYDYDPEAKQSPEELAAAIEAHMKREPDVYDTHPPSGLRIEWAERVGAPHEPRPDDDVDVWDLFPEPEQIERAMTAIVRERIQQQHGIVVSDLDDDELGEQRE